MKTHISHCHVDDEKEHGFVDITEDVADALAGSGIQDGRVALTAGGDATLLLNERESGLMADIHGVVQKLGLRRRLLGSKTVVVPAVAGQLKLGAWQRILVAGPGADRSVTIHVIGV